MKVKPSDQPGHVVFDLASRDIAMLAQAQGVPELTSTVVEMESSFCEQLYERANKQTSLLEEILFRSQLLASLEIKRSKLVGMETR